MYLKNRIQETGCNGFLFIITIKKNVKCLLSEKVQYEICFLLMVEPWEKHWLNIHVILGLAWLCITYFVLFNCSIIAWKKCLKDHDDLFSSSNSDVCHWWAECSCRLWKGLHCGKINCQWTTVIDKVNHYLLLSSTISSQLKIILCNI